MRSRAFAAILGAAILAGACEHSLKSADAGPTEEPIRASSGPAPETALVVRANLLPGRPIPYRLTLRNVTDDVLVPISAEASAGVGIASYARPVIGDVTYDAQTDRYLENPVVQRSASPVLYRAALFPGEAIVEDIDVRYPHAGAATEKVRVLYHRLSRSEFDSRVYVATGGALPRRFAPIGLLSDKSAREGALLAGFYLRLQRPPEAVFATVDVEMPAVPPAVAVRIKTAGLDPEGALASSWTAGWIAGDGERSVVVTGDQTKPLPGVPIEVIRMIDAVQGEVPFCINGATREEIAPLFSGYEIIPHKCLHVSVPRDAILRTLEKIGGAGYAVVVTDFQLHGALDIAKRKAPAATPTPEATAVPSKKAEAARRSPRRCARVRRKRAGT